MAACFAFYPSTGCSFVLLYGAIAQHFSSKMSRLLLICGPICSITAAIWGGVVLDFLLLPVFQLFGKKFQAEPPAKLTRLGGVTELRSRP